MNSSLYGHLRFSFNQIPITSFSPLLQKGFYVETVTCKLLDLLCLTCGLEPHEVQARIQTLFLNGKPVDDIVRARVKNEDCLALSSAMPGLVGATMRSGGVLAGFRRSISHRSQSVESGEEGGIISIKLFNLLINEIGPRFLKQSILVLSIDLRDLLASWSDLDWKRCLRVELNRQIIHADTLLAKDWSQEPEFICLQAAEGGI